jgi:hypothetical protein
LEFRNFSPIFKKLGDNIYREGIAMTGECTATFEEKAAPTPNHLVNSGNVVSTLNAPCKTYVWPAPGFTDTELGVLMEPEVDHGEAEVYARVQA